MEKIAGEQTWKEALSKAKLLNANDLYSAAAKSLLPYIKELQDVPPSEQMIRDLHRLSTRKLGCALWEQAKGLENAFFALEYAKTLLTPGKTLVEKLVSLKKYFSSRCDINYNYLFHMPLPTERVKSQSAWLHLTAIPSFLKR